MRLHRTFSAGLVALLFSLGINAQQTSYGWYNGDCQSGVQSYSNWFASNQRFSRIYDDFVVPAAGWTITGVFSINSMSVEGITAAAWEIRSGVTTADHGTVVASGMSAATQTFLYTWADGTKHYRIEVNGLRARLDPGTYWLNVSPVVLSTDSFHSYVCATQGINGTGNPHGNNGNAFLDKLSIPDHPYAEAPIRSLIQMDRDYSQGVTIAASPAALPAPAIAAIVNSASWQAGPLSPGEMVTIQGSALGGDTPSTMVLDPDGRAATSLNGVRVLFDGVAAPEIYAGSTQINAVVPYEVAGNSSTTVTVTVNGRTSSKFLATMASTAPALFTASGSGSGPAAVLNQDGSYNDPSHPAERGSYVVLYLTGEGLTNPAVTGKITTIAASAPLTPQPLLPVTVSISGQSAPVLFYGEAVGMIAGVMQLNIQIPSGVASGDLPLSVSVGPNSTQDNVTISVK